MSEKIKVLLWADYCCGTGFGQVSSNIWRHLCASGKYDIDIVGINHTGDPYDASIWPGNVYPALSGINAGGKYADLYGRQKLMDMLGFGEYDILWMLQDTFILEPMMEAILDTQSRHHHPFKTVFYFPIDAAPKDEWVTEVVSKINYPVAYTNYASDECLKIDPTLKNKLRVIYHGNNFTDYYPIEDTKELDEFRHYAFRGEADGKFLLTNINRNQRRKDICRSFMVLRELYDRGIDDVMLYLHMAPVDAGGNIFDMAKNFGFELNKHYLMPENFNPHSGFPIEIVNKIYNASDAILTTTMGEGWGLSITEAMATKTPIIAPDHTSITEILADNRGYLIKAGHNPSMWMIKDNDNDRLRPLMDVDDAVDKIELLLDGTLPDIEGAFQFAQSLDWANIAAQWDTLIEEAVNAPAMYYSNRKFRRELAKKK